MSAELRPDHPLTTPAYVLDRAQEILDDFAESHLRIEAGGFDSDLGLNIPMTLERIRTAITENTDGLYAIESAIHRIVRAIEDQRVEPALTPTPTRPREKSASNGHARGGIPLGDLKI